MSAQDICTAIRELRPERYDAAYILSALLENLGFSDKQVTEALVAAFEVLDEYCGNQEAIAYESQAEQDTTRI